MKNIQIENAEPFLRRGSSVLTLFFAMQMLIPLRANAQWQRIYFEPDLYGGGGGSWATAIPVIYFLNLPGPPRIGFSTVFDHGGYDVYKTTDGGFTWFETFPLGLALDFTFKDSLIGWASISERMVTKTTDGGMTWIQEDQKDLLLYGEVGGGGIYYDSISDGLFTGDYLWAGDPFSWDEGATWVNQQGLTGGEGFAFVNNDSGILTNYMLAGGGSDIYLWYRTTDAGHHWSPLYIDSPCYQPVGIWGTSTYLVCTLDGTILRSADNGTTWDSLATLPGPPRPFGGWPGGYTGPSDGDIEGDSSNLYAVTQYGCYHSTDLGKSWKFLCGQHSDYLLNSRFYAKGHRVYMQTLNYDSTTAQGILDDSSTSSIWYLNLDSMQYFPTGVVLPSGAKDTTVIPGNAVTINFIPETTDPISLDSGTLIFHFDPNVLGLSQIKLPTKWQLVDSSVSNGILRIHFLASDSLPNPIAQLIFSTYLSPETSSASKVYLDSASLFGHRLNCDCQALSILQPDSISHSAPDSVQINFLMACGDSTLLAAMEHQPPFSIENIVPNPAGAALRVQGIGYRVQGLEVQLFDALGNCVITEHDPIPYTLSPTPYTLPLDVSSLPSGIYFLRVSNGGYAVSRSVAIRR